MLIQIVLVVVIVAGGLALLRAPGGARNQALRRLGVLALAAFAVVTVLAPTTMTRLAGLVGVGRGTDLLLYGLAVTFFGYTVTSYRRTRLFEEQMTALARGMALTEAAAMQAQAAASAVQEQPRQGDGASR